MNYKIAGDLQTVELISFETKKADGKYDRLINFRANQIDRDTDTYIQLGNTHRHKLGLKYN